ncbi:MAG TPA: class I SAM-dependent methyltransferase [Cellvibrio sp.]|nr:class I SAM-dependent methyltransferase [Cellvibrio sp.]
MQSEEIKAVFDSQASGYDKQWARMSPVRDGLYFLLGAVFSGLPKDARVLCVGAGTGIEMSYLAKLFPGWRFTAVEPSGPMLDMCRMRAREEGFFSRCDFHEGYLDSLPPSDPYDGATCFLVSQFILDREERVQFFRSIADRLVAGGVLASSDLASDVESDSYQALLRVWIHLMSSSGVQPEILEKTRAAYAKDVSILRSAQVASIITAAGFESSIQFYQSGLMHAWYSIRATSV